MNYDYVRSLEYAQKALESAQMAGEKLMADYCRLDVAKQFLSKGDYRQAEDNLREVISSGSNSRDLLSQTYLTLARTLIYKPDPDMESARDYLLKIPETTNPASLEKNMMYMTKLAAVLEHEGNSSLSDEYMNRSSSLLNSPIDSVIYLDSRRRILASRGNWKEAYHTLSLAFSTEDRIVTGLLSRSVTHSMENYFSDKLEIDHARSTARLYMMGMIESTLLIIIIVLVLAVRKKNRMLLDDLAKIEEVGEDLRQLRLKNASSFKLFESFISDKVKSLQQLSDSYYSWDDAVIKKREKTEGKLMKEEIIDAFRKQLEELRSDHSFISALEQSLDLSNDGLMEKARKALKKGKELDYSVLVLLFSGFSIKSISFLLRMSEASLRMRKTRLKQYFSSMPEPERSLFLERLG